MAKKSADSKKPAKSPKAGAASKRGPVPPVPPVAAPTSGRGRPGARLTPEQLAAVLELLPASDSVELKVTVPEEAQRSTIAALDMDPLYAQIRQVFFYDTPDLALDQVGVVVRARRIQGKGGDSVVKLRPVVPQELSSDLRHSPTFVVEVDAMPGGFVCSGTLKNRVDADDVRRVAAGRLPLRKLFTKQQRALVSDRAPGGLEFDGLSLLGPIFVLKLPFTPADLKRRLVAEMWLYPDGSRILELSTKCLPSEIIPVLAETRRFLDDRGIDRSGDQQAKTKRALTFFAKELKAVQSSQADPTP